MSPLRDDLCKLPWRPAQFCLAYTGTGPAGRTGAAMWLGRSLKVSPRQRTLVSRSRARSGGAPDPLSLPSSMRLTGGSAVICQIYF